MRKDRYCRGRRGQRPNGWMVGYAKDEDCPLAFACVVEDSGFGFTYAGPVVEAAMIQAAKSLVQLPYSKKNLYRKDIYI